VEPRAKGGVLDRGDVPGRLPAGAAQRHRVGRYGDDAAVGATAPELGVPIGQGVDRGSEASLDPGAILRVDGQREAVAREHLGTEAEQLLHPRVGVDAPSRGIRDQHPGWQRVDQRLEAGPVVHRGRERQLA
jgi:hypothetical protein